MFTEDDEGVLVRTLTDIELREVSIVTFPAYPDTSIAKRSVLEWREGIEQASTSAFVERYRARAERELRLRGLI